jgi:hypothetical protein
MRASSSRGDGALARLYARPVVGGGAGGGIRKGREVTEESTIGYAGATGGPNFPVGYPHLHRAFYRKPRYNRDGSPYGGQGQEVLYHHCAGTAAGSETSVYRFGGEVTRATASKGSWISK